MNPKSNRPSNRLVPTRLRLVSSASDLLKTDTLVLFLADSLAASLPPGSPHKMLLQRMIREIHQSKEFRSKEAETAVLHTWGNLPWKQIVLVSLGKASELSRLKFFRAGAAVSRRAGKAAFSSLAIWLPVQTSKELTSAMQAQAIIEGIRIGAYDFQRFKTVRDTQPPRLKEVVLAVDRREKRAVEQAVQKAERIADAVNYAREIANLPGNMVDPQKLAEEARALGRTHGLRVTIWDPARLRKEKFGGILAVGNGSEREPRFIRIDYSPRSTAGRSRAPLVLVGKAITFDSGGISIKPSEKMDEMKFDKCGGVTVLGAMRAIASLRLPVPVTGLIAAAENMPSATSYRPGDIVTTYSGTTIEVLNTDAEGRIVLGDALGYACDLKPEAIVDFATLTGACVVALGSFAAGLFCNNARLSERLSTAAEATGERVWPFPLWQEYHDKIKSQVADIKNTGGREGGAITAAAFLQKFVGDIPWAHLDIAGTAWTTEEKPYLARGGTAYGVRLLIDMITNWKPL